LIGGGPLLLAVDDVLIDGERLEGVDVTPTIEVQTDPACAGQGILSWIGQSRCWPEPEPRN